MTIIHDIRVISACAAALLITPAISPALRAQTRMRGASSVSDTLDIARVLELAASNSPIIKGAAAYAAAARLRIAAVSRLPDPEIQIGWMNRRLPSLAPMPTLGMTELQIMQMLPSPSKLRLATLVRRESALAEEERLTAAQWEIRTRAAVAFYDVYTTSAQIAVAEDSRNLLRDIAALARQMYAAGDGKQADVLRAQVELERMNAELFRMQNMRSAAGARLNAVIGLEPAPLVSAAKIPDVPDSLPPLEALVAEAVGRRPMIAAASRDVAAATAAEKLARKELWPDLRIGVQFGFQRSEMGPERMASLMIGASVPVYARSRQLSMRGEADAMRLMALAEESSMRVETGARMTELYAEFTSARDLASLYRSTVLPQSQASIAASLSAYRAGTVNMMTVLDNQMTLNRFRQELIALDGDRTKAIAEMEMLLGRQLFDPAAPARNAR